MFAVDPVREIAMQSFKGTTVTMVIDKLNAIDSYGADMNSVVSPEILALVFEDKSLPFQTNPDGSVDMTVYMSWLENIWTKAVEEFDEHFDSVEPRRIIE
jgi:hypothetical protein